MARYRGPRLRLVRRLGELPALTRKGTTRVSTPGQHGATPKKLSQYGIRLQEKQKLRFNYGVSESQLMRYVRQAKRSRGSTGDVLLQSLEMRLDNIVFRLGMAPTIVAARQLVSHGHVTVNGSRVNVPSYSCKVKDTISVANKKASKDLVNSFIENSNQAVIPSHLSFNKESLVGVVNGVVNRDAVGIQLNELLIVEFYSRKL
jgi:small subunit ribosomal protein S4